MQPFGEGVEEDIGCTLLLPGDVSRNAASCTQPCPFNTKGLGVPLGAAGAAVGHPSVGWGGDPLLVCGRTLFFML